MENILVPIFGVIIVALLIALCCVIAYKPKIVEISDTLPKSGNRRDCWLKLQNEGKHHLRIKDGKVYLKIVK